MINKSMTQVMFLFYFLKELVQNYHKVSAYVII